MDESSARILAEVKAALSASDWLRAAELSETAIGRGILAPLFFMVRAQKRDETGQLELALEDYRRAAELAPQDARIHDAVGICALKLEKIREALKAFDTAIALEPGVAAIHFRRAFALGMAGNHQASQSAYEKTLELDPDFAAATANLASIAARKRQSEKARKLAGEVLAREPRNAVAIVANVTADLSERRFEDAEQRLTRALADGTFSPAQRPSALGMLGDALDGQKRFAEAYAQYRRANDELRRLNLRNYLGSPVTEAARRLTAYFETRVPTSWERTGDFQDACGTARGHVFLLGFMRSGTTLLEQILASNPDIVALEEKGLLAMPGENFLTSEAGLNRLAALAGSELHAERHAYWSRVDEQGLDVRGKIFIDKQPLNTTKLPLIAKLFPDAKILFALRDPRDVVFSCFRRHFKINATNFEFLSLNDTARFYSAVMQLSEVVRALLPLNLYEHRYEAMIEDFDGRVRAVCDFIGVPWDETMRKFDEHAPAVDLRSPSATQVRRPLYGEGIGQWRRYSAQLAPILPILQPWVEKFGYPAD